MGRQKWARWAAALTAVVLLGAVLSGIPSSYVGAFQAATPIVGDGTDATAQMPVASPTASHVASPIASHVASPIASPVALPAAAVNQVFVSGVWRIEVAAAQQASAFPDFKLSASTGRAWIVLVLDVANWSGKDAKFTPKNFSTIAAGATDGFSLAPVSSKRIAKTLGFKIGDPTATVTIKKNASARFALAFQIDSTALNYALSYGNATLPLGPSFTQAVAFDAVSDPTPLPDLNQETFSSAQSGASVKLKSGTVALAGVDAPTGAECYSAQAAARITKLVKGKKIESQAAGNGSLLWIDQSDGSRVLLNQALVSGGYAAALPTGGPFDAWLAGGETAAKAASGGLWGACTNQHGQARSTKAETTPLAALSDGQTRPYVAWIAYPPKIVTTPDGGAWAFYSAQPTAGADKSGERLFASHFDPSTGKWSTGQAMPGGQFQMGPSAAVDSAGIVHLVYSDQAKPGSFATLMYTHEDGSGGWTKPMAISIDPDAGHQLYPSLAIDKNDVLHVAWQDQRIFSAKARAANASNADILVSDYKQGDPNWSKPFLVNTHFFDSASLLPHLVVDGDRLVMTWSVYSLQFGLTTAARIDWATRPIGKPLEWTLGQPLVAGRGDAFGGRLVDLAADPTGGVVMVFARQDNETFLFLRRLKPGATEWSGDILIAYGARGNYPVVTVTANGTVYVTYEAVVGKDVKVASVAVPYRSVVPGPETILTTGEANSQGRPGETADLTSQPWIVYIAESSDGKTNQVMALRNASVPAVAAAKTS